MADLNFAGSYDGLHLPYSPEAEQAVLGAIILERLLILRKAPIISMFLCTS